LLYAVRLRPDDNGTLLVTSRDVPELTTFGEDGKEALHHAAAALTGLIESYMDRGLPIPTPRAKPGSRNLVVVPTLLAAAPAVHPREAPAASCHPDWTGRCRHAMMGDAAGTGRPSDPRTPPLACDIPGCRPVLIG
jgi:predicted RNase H-like HicB family nuclease